MILLTTVLVTGIFTTNVSSVFADSRLLKQDTKQAANCDSAGAGSPLSGSCNERAANNVINGILTAGTPGTLLINELCFGVSCPHFPFNIIVTGNNPQPSSFSFRGPSNSQLVTLGPGSFEITESTASFRLIY